jgi:hypothetical protein
MLKSKSRQTRAVQTHDDAVKMGPFNMACLVKFIQAASLSACYWYFEHKARL